MHMAWVSQCINLWLGQPLNGGSNPRPSPLQLTEPQPTKEQSPDPVNVMPISQYHNPNALARLVGRANEVDVIIDGQKVMAPIDTRTQVSSMYESYCKTQGYEIHPVGHMLHFESTGGFSILYLGFA